MYRPEDDDDPAVAAAAERLEIAADGSARDRLRRADDRLVGSAAAGRDEDGDHRRPGASRRPGGSASSIVAHALVVSRQHASRSSMGQRMADTDRTWRRKPRRPASAAYEISDRVRAPGAVRPYQRDPRAPAVRGRCGSTRSIRRCRIGSAGSRRCRCRTRSWSRARSGRSSNRRRQARRRRSRRRR